MKEHEKELLGEINGKGFPRKFTIALGETYHFRPERDPSIIRNIGMDRAV